MDPSDGAADVPALLAAARRFRAVRRARAHFLRLHTIHRAAEVMEALVGEMNAVLDGVVDGPGARLSWLPRADADGPR